jgi:RHS repeat-associated protein
MASGLHRAESGTLSTDFLFTGEQFDAKARLPQAGKDVGLYYLRARYYDPIIGRFLTRDPFGGWVGSPQSQNPYAYVMNNPAVHTDPLGLWGLGDLADAAGGIGEALTYFFFPNWVMRSQASGAQPGLFSIS